MRGFRGSILFTVAALVVAAAARWAQTGDAGMAGQAALLAAVLGVMETSLSLDNAVVNSTILKDMDPVWQRRFLTWGVLVAVFGMRLAFPIAIVSVSAAVSPAEAVRIALFDHARYEAVVTGAHVGIAGFGGAFLLLVGLGFFLDPDREHLWIGAVERPLMALGRSALARYALVAATLALTAALLHGHGARTLLVAGAAGMAAHLLVDRLGDAIGGGDDAAGTVARAGLGAFVYLETLDASFSFDGVIGAFAVTNDIVTIALGLGIGAMFVRSMTIALVRGGTLGEYRFLEPGAFYAILALAVLMLADTLAAVPQIVTGLVGAAIIGAAFMASLSHRRRFPDEYGEAAEPLVVMPGGDVARAPK